MGSAAKEGEEQEVKGKRIRTLRCLAELAANRRAVVSAHHPKPMPAAIAFNMPGSILLRWLNTGIYEYHKKKI